jgi:hypothetical protein
MNNCKNCANAVFDTLWGDYKCKEYQVIVHPDQKIDCELYKKGNPAEGKGIENRE